MALCGATALIQRLWTDELSAEDLQTLLRIYAMQQESLPLFQPTTISIMRGMRFTLTENGIRLICAM